MTKITYMGNIDIRLDKYLASIQSDKSRNQIQKMINSSLIKVNNMKVKPNYRLRSEDRITISNVKEKKLIGWNEKLNVIYEDKDIIIINKPLGMVVHPTPNNNYKTLANILIFYYPEINNVGETHRPGIIHRLDKDTSGIIVVAKNQKSYLDLTKQFKKRTVFREYLALVHGKLKEEKGIINKPIGRDPNNRTKMKVINKNSKEAITKYEVIKNSRNYSLLKVKLITGRMHQIRVHLSHYGHPVVGDKKYGKKDRCINQMLHAYKIGFIHPSTKKYVEYKTNIPERIIKKVGEI